MPDSEQVQTERAPSRERSGCRFSMMVSKPKTKCIWLISSSSQLIARPCMRLQIASRPDTSQMKQYLGWLNSRLHAPPLLMQLSKIFEKWRAVVFPSRRQQRAISGEQVCIQCLQDIVLITEENQTALAPGTKCFQYLPAIQVDIGNGKIHRRAMHRGNYRAAKPKAPAQAFGGTRAVGGLRALL